MAEEKAETKTNETEVTSAVGGDNFNTDEICIQEEDISKILNALAEKNRLLEEHAERYVRLQADFDNFRRRTRQEKEELSVIVAQGIVLQLLPVLDNFERALASDSDQEAGLRTGVEMIYRQFIQVFEKMGVETIPAVGMEFDPQVHDAVMSVEDAGQTDGVIAEELQKGYTLKGKVVRPSMVKVFRNS